MLSRGRGDACLPQVPGWQDYFCSLPAGAWNQATGLLWASQLEWLIDCGSATALRNSSGGTFGVSFWWVPGKVGFLLDHSWEWLEPDSRATSRSTVRLRSLGLSLGACIGMSPVRSLADAAASHGYKWAKARLCGPCSLKSGLRWAALPLVARKVTAPAGLWVGRSVPSLWLWVYGATLQGFFSICSQTEVGELA